eukprot:jgi/Mesvir1/16241/Mv08495-RA.1
METATSTWGPRGGYLAWADTTQGHINALDHQLRATAAQLDATERELETCQAQLRDTETRLLEEQQRYRLADRQVAEEANRVKLLGDMLEEERRLAKLRAAELQEENRRAAADAAERHTRLQAENAALRAQITQLEDKADQMGEERVLACMQRDVMEKETRRFAADLARAEEALAAASQELDMLRVRLARSDKARESYEDRLLRLEKENMRMQVDIKEHNRLAAHASSRIHMLETDKRRLEKDVQHWQRMHYAMASTAQDKKRLIEQLARERELRFAKSPSREKPARSEPGHEAEPAFAHTPLRSASKPPVT